MILQLILFVPFTPLIFGVNGSNNAVMFWKVEARMPKKLTRGQTRRKKAQGAFFFILGGAVGPLATEKNIPEHLYLLEETKPTPKLNSPTHTATLRLRTS